MVQFKRSANLLLTLCLVAALLPVKTLAVDVGGSEIEAPTVGETQSVDDAVNGQPSHAEVVEAGGSDPAPAPTAETELGHTGGNEEKPITRIAWIHELAARFIPAQRTTPTPRNLCSQTIVSRKNSIRMRYGLGVWNSSKIMRRCPFNRLSRQHASLPRILWFPALT